MRYLDRVSAKQEKISLKKKLFDNRLQSGKMKSQEETMSQETLSLKLASANVRCKVPYSKRLIDVTVSSLLLLLLAPLFALVAIAIKLDSPGPIFYGGVHVGKDGKLFTMWKFRTMYKDTPGDLSKREHLGEIAKLNEGGNMLVKVRNDPRVTRLGKILRRTSINELPQLYNVLKGEMSLVGPRPQAPYEVAEYTEEQKRRLMVLPGISGWWQVTSRNSPSFDEFIRRDLEYVDNWSLWLDLKILLKTIPAVIKGTGPYY